MNNDVFEKLTALFESEDADLFKPKEKRKTVTADDRLLEGFEQIVEFVNKNNRLPSKEAEDMKEAGFYARLASIRADKDKVEKLTEYDELGLLETDKIPESLDELYAMDGDLFSGSELFDISRLPKQKREVLVMGEIAKRKPCKDFAKKFKGLFMEQQQMLADGLRKLTPFLTIDQLLPNNFYVYEGMMCYVAGFGERERKSGGYSQQRINVIFENGTESNMYKRSLAQRLYEGGFVVVDKDFELKNEEKAVGYIYILKSLSEDHAVVTIKDLYKIGVTTDVVEKRIANAEIDPTYLMAPVKIVASYKLTGAYQPVKVESLIHRFFADAKVDLEIIDKLGVSYVPDEWYSAPIEAIEEAVDRIGDKSIVDFYYNSDSQRVEKIK
ncbi:MAG: hypothetical protein UY41_C0022G0005 [Candidatus Moranbacteria bacterium GW2011_GWE1_49_15]|nr:MAG: hypothetical protein UX75_C0041G0007 [Candidatus Moranbacteria bacterium GW2011_GWE2_47_10]KKW06526.1 MAG: hypothetical protein UY41_C0022G0005 [Candidatus Moranbacteria bacterium GW2011_GWE1_49_15]